MSRTSTDPVETVRIHTGERRPGPRHELLRPFYHQVQAHYDLSNEFFDFTYLSGGYTTDPLVWIPVEAPADRPFHLNWEAFPSAGASIEGEFSNVTSSYAGKGVVRYTW